MAFPKIQKLARSLLAFEAAHDTMSASSADAVMRVVEKLRVHLIKLVGVDGFRALLSRALALAKVETLSLHTVYIRSDGSVEGFNKIEQSGEPEAAKQAGVALIAHLLELLVTFTGESLTLRLVYDIWPTVSTDEAAASTNEKDLRTEEQP